MYLPKIRICNGRFAPGSALLHRKKYSEAKVTQLTHRNWGTDVNKQN